MKLSQLESLIAIADGQGIAGAAKKLNVSRPAITKNLAGLEHELGVPLFDRSAYRLKPNAYGERLLPRARTILAEHDQAKREIDLMKQQQQQVIRLTASPIVLPVLIPQALQLTQQKQPSINLDFIGDVAASHEEKFKNLAEGKTDLLISDIKDSDDLDDFHYEPLITVKLSVLASKQHPINQQDKLSLNDLHHYKCLAPQKSNEMFIARKAFYEQGARFPETITTLPILQMLLTLLCTGEYIAFIPYHPALIDETLDDFGFIELDEALPSWQLYLLQRKLYEPSAAQQLFIEKLKESVH